nr:ORF6N domain-containing protein [Odoribacter lunatus]
MRRFPPDFMFELTKEEFEVQFQHLKIFFKTVHIQYQQPPIRIERFLK